MATALHCPKIASPKIKHPKKAFISVQSPNENWIANIAISFTMCRILLQFIGLLLAVPAILAYLGSIP